MGVHLSSFMFWTKKRKPFPSDTASGHSRTSVFESAFWFKLCLKCPCSVLPEALVAGPGHHGLSLLSFPTYPPLPGLPRIWTILSCPPFLLDCQWFYFECLGWIHFLWPHRQCVCCHQEESTACAAPGTPQSRVGLDLQCLELVLIFKTFCTLKIHMLNSRFIFRGCVIVRPVSSQFRHIDSYNFFSFSFWLKVQLHQYHLRPLKH